jgi:exopolysaccharide biosynthesis predicted pyruvyltransferase EpsI
VYVDELPGGNNGDQLIILGSRSFHRAYGFDLVDRPEDAEAIIVRGNGVLTDFYAHTPHRAKIQSYIDRFPAAAVVVEPSTFSFAAEPAFRVGARDADVHLYARDATSYDAERAKDGYAGARVAFGLDHDMAFHLAGSELVRDLAARRDPRHVLIAERYDIERPGRELRPRTARAAAARLAPAFVKDLVRPHLARRRARSPEGLQRDAIRVLAPGADELGPTVVGDLSNPRLYPFDEFLEVVAGSRAVVTQRLHVGVLSALLGIDTWLDDRGYYKIRGIWEQSMRSMPHVHLLSDALGGDG